jgi:hypothetical protein
VEEVAVEGGVEGRGREKVKETLGGPKTRGSLVERRRRRRRRKKTKREKKS